LRLFNCLNRFKARLGMIDRIWQVNLQSIFIGTLLIASYKLNDHFDSIDAKLSVFERLNDDVPPLLKRHLTPEISSHLLSFL
jgi:hypothetical protein